jgi:excisionase family DNA binding protein
MEANESVRPTESTPSDGEILTIEEVASYLRLKTQTIYRWAQGSRIPAVKLGKEWRFRKSIIDRWLEEQMLAGNPDFEHLKGLR